MRSLRRLAVAAWRSSSSLSPSLTSSTARWPRSPSCSNTLPAVASAVPMSVAGSPRSSGLAASRNSLNVAWSEVSGSCRNALPPKTMSPTRSPGDADTISQTASLAAARRLGVTSVTVIERERSRTTSMSLPVRASSAGRSPSCGRASAITPRASAAACSQTRRRAVRWSRSADPLPSTSGSPNARSSASRRRRPASIAVATSGTSAAPTTRTSGQAKLTGCSGGASRRARCRPRGAPAPAPARTRTARGSRASR